MDKVMSQHTPGPMTIEKEPSGLSVPFRVADANGNVFAHAFDEQDARLIAAAPEMLQALKELIWEIESWTSLETPEFKTAKALITKIEGKG